MEIDEETRESLREFRRKNFFVKEERDLYKSRMYLNERFISISRDGLNSTVIGFLPEEAKLLLPIIESIAKG